VTLVAACDGEREGRKERKKSFSRILSMFRMRCGQIRFTEARRTIRDTRIFALFAAFAFPKQGREASSAC